MRNTWGLVGLAVVGSLFAVGCSATRAVTKDRHSWSVLAAAGESTQAIENVEMTVEPIASTDAAEVRDLLYFDPQQDYSPYGSRHEYYSRMTSPVTWPVFVVKVKNNTGHVISFKGAVVALVNSDGETFQPNVALEGGSQVATDYSDPRAMVEAAQSSAEKYQRIGALKGKYRWLGQNEDPILPEGVYKALLVYNVPKERLAARSVSWKLKVYDFVVETDPAGNATKKAKFEFAFKPYELVFETERVACTDAAVQGWTSDAKCRDPRRAEAPSMMPGGPMMPMRPR